MESKSLGEIAYDAYGKTTDFKNYQGLPMPTWGNLTDKIREAWENAANAVAAVSVGITGEPGTSERLAQIAKAHPIDFPAWRDSFDERQQTQINFARLYAREFHHGADGHNNMMILAKMADLLDDKNG